MPITLPYFDERTTLINDRQKIESKVSISQEGVMTLKSHYWNNQQIDGDHYVSLAVAYDTDKNILVKIWAERGLNAKFFGKTVEKDSLDNVQIAQEILLKIESVGIEHFLIDRKNDKLTWGTALEVGQKVLELVRKL